MWKLTVLAALALFAAAPGLAHEGGHKAHGIVKELTAAHIVVTDERGKETEFTLTSGTLYLRDRKAVPRDSVRAGERVVVKGRDVGGTMEATHVMVGMEKKPDH